MSKWLRHSHRRVRRAALGQYSSNGHTSTGSRRRHNSRTVTWLPSRCWAFRDPRDHRLVRRSPAGADQLRRADALQIRPRERKLGGAMAGRPHHQWPGDAPHAQACPSPPPWLYRMPRHTQGRPSASRSACVGRCQRRCRERYENTGAGGAPLPAAAVTIYAMPDNRRPRRKAKA